MSIRTSEKRKLPPYDSLTETQPEQTSKHSKNAKPPKDKDTRSQNENSNTSNENESKGRHKLRNSSEGIPGKYKNMNSGKHLYQSNAVDKRNSISKKKQFRFFSNESVSQFKKFLTHLQKKDEEITLNKKRKKEEGKQKTKSDKLRNQTRIPSQNYTNINLSQMEMYNNRNYLHQRGCRGNPMYAQQGYQFPQGSDQRFLVNGNASGDYKGDYPCAPIELKETINVQYMERCFKREIVNHIVGALYIQQAINKSNEQKKMQANGIEDEQNKMQQQPKEDNLFQQINNDTHNESNLNNENKQQDDDNKEQVKESEYSNEKNEEDSQTQKNNTDKIMNENENNNEVSDDENENVNNNTKLPNITCW